MIYSTRNSFYLRISKNTILPIYLYLDDRHVNWMTDKTLQHVLSDLRPNILPKLKAEADIPGSSSTQKKATVDTHRGDAYQFCYFIRKTEPHSVLIKARNFTFAPSRPKNATLHPKQTTSKGKQRKRKETSQDRSSAGTRSKKRRISRQTVPDNLSDDEVEMTNRDEGLNESDEEYLPATEDANPTEESEENLELEIVEEEEKPKPVLGLTYQGFNIYGQCLCIVVEPWPAARAMPFPISLGSPRLASQMTLETQVSTHAKAPNAPLFLPEEPDEVEIVETNRSHVDRAYLDKVLNTIEVSDDEDDMGGMMEFSQVLHNIGDSRAGAINDDDDMDGSVFFGDADEFKEL